MLSLSPQKYIIDCDTVPRSLVGVLNDFHLRFISVFLFLAVGAFLQFGFGISDFDGVEISRKCCPIYRCFTTAHHSLG